MTPSYGDLLKTAYRVATSGSEDYDFNSLESRRNFVKGLAEQVPGYGEKLYEKAALDLWRFDLMARKFYRDAGIARYEIALQKLKRRCPGFEDEQYGHRLSRSHLS